MNVWTKWLAAAVAMTLLATCVLWGDNVSQPSAGAGVFTTAITSGRPYEGAPKKLPAKTPPSASTSDRDVEWCGDYRCQTHNIKSDGLYDGIEVGDNAWIRMACDEARQSVDEGGGPFGAVVVQIDDSTGKVLRYWRERNQVVSNIDPSAHAEVNVVRAACRDLGVFDLGQIRADDPNLRLPQDGPTSHCEVYSSCEPCPMCYATIRWARIRTIVFAATRSDAAEPGVQFSDLEMYDEFATPYHQRNEAGLQVLQSTAPNSLDAFNRWKSVDNTNY